jgi:hypothetical protein
MSGLSIALVISVSGLSADAGLSWVVTAVIGGAIGTELLVRDRRTAGAADDEADRAAAPIDELDGDDSGRVAGPIYRDDSEPHRGPSRRSGAP